MNETFVTKCPDCKNLIEYKSKYLALSSTACENCNCRFDFKKHNVGTFTREQAVRTVIDMATRYDFDIEGCNGDDLLKFTGAIDCCFRLAYILKYGKFPPTDGDAWSVEFAELFKEIAREAAKSDVVIGTSPLVGGSPDGK